MRRKEESIVIYFGFNVDAEDIPAVQLVGWQNIKKHEPYHWDMRSSRVKRQRYLFQYTVSGEGVVEMMGVPHRVRANQAFLIEKPGEFSYYLPEDSDHWNVKFIDLSSVMPYWGKLIESAGRIVELPPGCGALQVLDDIHERAAADILEDPYQNSILAYTFMTELRRAVMGRTKVKTSPESVKRCVAYIEKHFGKPISLEDMALHVKLSPSYLSRIFLNTRGETPIQYLTKTRIKHASRLLMETNDSIDDIARLSGFANGNYMAKVFRKLLQAAPNEFKRSSKHNGSSIQFTK